MQPTGRGGPAFGAGAALPEAKLVEALICVGGSNDGLQLMRKPLGGRQPGSEYAKHKPS